MYMTFFTNRQPSCKDPNPSQDVTLSPEEGCLCMDGYILNNEDERCVALEECGCSTDDNYYAVRKTPVIIYIIFQFLFLIVHVFYFKTRANYHLQ